MDVEIESTVAEHRLRRPPLRRASTSATAPVVADGRQAEETSTYREVAVDFLGGCVSGCAGIVVGQVMNKAFCVDRCSIEFLGK